jgi:hypothetical protein
MFGFGSKASKAQARDAAAFRVIQARDAELDAYANGQEACGCNDYYTCYNCSHGIVTEYTARPVQAYDDADDWSPSPRVTGACEGSRCDGECEAGH